MSMGKPLKVLLVEDSERDAALLRLQLRRGGFEPSLDRVETPEEMSARLASFEWDVVISDGRLPRFSARDALGLLKESGRSIAFIMLSGELDEAVVAELMDSGATACLLKSDKDQIVATIEKIQQGRT